MITGKATSKPESQVVDSSKRGRQRSSESEDAVLAAVAELLKEMPLRDVTIEEIAKRAGVGKATIYRWWPSKAYVALDAFLRTMMRKVAVPDSGSARRDITEQLRSVIRFYTGPTGGIIRQFLAEGQIDPEFKKVFLGRFLGLRRDATRVMWERGIQRGEIDPTIDIDIAMDLVYGPMMFRLMTGHAPLNDKEAEGIVEAAFAGMGKSSPQSVRRQSK